MLTRRLATMGLLSFLLGCFSSGKPSPFSKQKGQWFYRDTPIEGSDASSFKVLDDHYAKDAKRVYFGETYRKGQEYWSIKHTRIVVIDGADAASFTVLDRDYARDRLRAYHEGSPFPVRDPATFEPLPGRTFARDAKVGYYKTREVPGSDGATFTALDTQYAKDAKHVFYCDERRIPEQRGPRFVFVTLDNADVATFVALPYEYASDARQAYYQGRVIASQYSTFEVLDYHYARTDKQVFYKGDVVKGADPATFSAQAAFDSAMASPPE